MKSPRTTIYLPCRNYAAFVGHALESLLQQTSPSWEAVVVDDGSTDGSWEVIQNFVSDSRIVARRNETPRGLRTIANDALRLSKGDFLLRLDADDVLHPMCIEILEGTLVRNPDAVVAFPDYYYIDDRGQVLGVEILPQNEGSYQAVTFPPHAAGALFRRAILEKVGPLAEDLQSQDGHELWLKIISNKLPFVHVPLPLFSYRKHGPSLSGDPTTILTDRASIKRRAAQSRNEERRVVAVIPVKDTYASMPDVAFMRYQNSSLIDRVITAASEVDPVDDILLTTDSERVTRYVATNYPRVVTLRRPAELLRENVRMVEILRHVRQEARLEDDAILVFLNILTPRRTSKHVQKTLDNFVLYEPDSAIAVYEDRNLMYRMGSTGLEAINPNLQHQLRREREVVYVDTGVARVFPARNLETNNYLGSRIGHALIHQQDALLIREPSDLVLLTAPDPLLMSGDQHVGSQEAPR